MANVNAPRGFVPVRTLHGGPITLREYSSASGYAANLGAGDPVELTGTGTNIQLAAAQNVDNLGVFAGVHYTNSSGDRVYSGYWASGTTGTDIVALVYVDPMIIYEIQADSVAAADVGALADWTVGTPSVTTQQSTTYLAVSSATATTGKSIRIVKLASKVDNAYGAYAKLEVVFAEHIFLTGAAAAGGV